MQIKTICDFISPQSGRLISTKELIKDAVDDVGKEESSLTVGRSANWHNHLRISMENPQKTENKSTTTLLGICQSPQLPTLGTLAQLCSLPF